jgi:hypothetical protein
MIKYIIGFVLSVILGGSIALIELRSISKSVDFMEWNGPWRVNPSMDLKNDKQRALISLVGLFALRESEVLYYTATVDSNGDQLSSDYDYKLIGSVPEARYWSYTIYGEDDFLIPNSDKVYGYNASTISYEPIDSLNPEMNNLKANTYEMYISKDKKEKNWLPSGDNNKIAITLRMYNPSPDVYKNLKTIPLPEIIRI